MTTIKSGTVKYPANKAFPDKYNEGAFKQNLVLQMEDNTEETIWFTQGRIPHSTLPKGAAVQVLFEERDGKTTRKLIDNSTAISQNQPQPKPKTNSLLAPEQKIAIANYINEQGDLLSYCWDTANAKFQNKIHTEESLRYLATTLYSSAKEKFNF